MMLVVVLTGRMVVPIECAEREGIRVAHEGSCATLVKWITLKIDLLSLFSVSGRGDWVYLCMWSSDDGGDFMNGQDVIDVEPTEAPVRGGSRFNAVKHGLYAKTAVLPGEDAQAFQALVEVYREGLQPRNGMEEDLAVKAALASWQHDRAVAADQPRAEMELDAQEKAATAERLEVLDLGNRLLFDRRGATAMYGSREYYSKQPRTSYSGDSRDPDQPGRLVLQLEQTAAGCRWLLAQWIEIRTILERGLGWQSREKLVVSRLLGMQPIEVAHKPELARIFIACHLIEPQYKAAFRELRCELDDPAYRHYNRCLTRRQIEVLKPADEADARAYLLSVVDKATERLRTIAAALEKKAEENRRGNAI